MGRHAKDMSPSGADRWVNCAGSVPLSAGLHDETSRYAAEGSCAHEVAALSLTQNTPAAVCIGRVFYDIPVTAQMTEHVEFYVQAVRDHLTHPSDDLHIEVEVPITPITGEADAVGTADAVVLSYVNQEITVIDLKYGRGLRVEAEQNLQLIIYALAMLELYGAIVEWRTVRLVIVQPRAGVVREWSITVEELGTYAKTISLAAERVRQAQREGAADYLNPGEKQCQWCRAKATCPALTAQVLADVPEVPVVTVTTEIAHLLPRIDLIEIWCKALRVEATRRLVAGIPVPGFKLIEGKKGHRAWEKDALVEALLKSMRLKQAQMYQFKLISPTQAEKLLKDQPKRWATLQAHITQKPGDPDLVPVSDRHPALTRVVSSSEFQPITT
ncbi:MAG: DUF2800 domain-containing protein [Proteobacteria bacterium]|nr:DUF2800 domain-containing protein [Pseudomonadota bacterium]